MSMSTDKTIRLAEEKDYAALVEIYAPYVTDTDITFEIAVPSVEEFAGRVKKIQKKYPWLVCEINGEVAGYAYASPFNERAAYDWSADLSIYVKAEYQKQRIGRALYTALLETLKLQGFYNVYGLVTFPNTNSEKFHQAFGFRQAGFHKNIAYKFDRWIDVKWFEMNIHEINGKPAALKNIHQVKELPEFKEILQRAETIILTR